MGILRTISSVFRRSVLKQSRNLKYEPGQISFISPWKNKFYSFRNLPAQISSANPYTQPFDIPIDTITTRVGFSFYPNGWHPFAETLNEYKANPLLAYEQSTLATLYRQYQPANLQELIFPPNHAPIHQLVNLPPDYYFLINIWRLSPAMIKKRLAELNGQSTEVKGWILHGPHSDEEGKKQFDRLINLYHQIGKMGYDPGLQTNHIDGYFLKHRDQMKFLLFQGNHRLAVLKCLGYTHAKVVIRPGYPCLLDRADLDSWVKNHPVFYDADIARQIFDSLFFENGHTKAANLGLINRPVPASC